MQTFNSFVIHTLIRLHVQQLLYCWVQFLTGLCTFVWYTHIYKHYGDSLWYTSCITYATVLVYTVLSTWGDNKLPDIWHFIKHFFFVWHSPHISLHLGLWTRRFVEEIGQSHWIKAQTYTKVCIYPIWVDLNEFNIQ